MLITSFSLLACINLWWRLNPKTLTWIRGQTVPNSQIFLILKNSSHIRFSLLTDNSIFSQGITHDDTLKGSDWDVWMIPRVFVIPAQHWYLYLIIQHQSKQYKTTWVHPCLLRSFQWYEECCHGLGDINETPKKTNKLIYGFAYMIHNMGTWVSSIGALVVTVLLGLHLGMFHLACRLTRILPY